MQAGTLVLTGNNAAFTGTTAISPGAVARRTGCQHSLAGDEQRGAALQFQPTAGTYAGAISGVGDIEKTGIGVTTLTGANTYGGATNINAGTLRVGAANALPTLTAVTVASGAVFDVNGVNQTIGSLAGARRHDARRGRPDDGRRQFQHHILRNNQRIGRSYQNRASGVFTLSGANTYGGATNINAGTLRVGAANALPTLTAVTVASGAVFDVNGVNQTIGSLSCAGDTTLGAGALTTGGDNSSTTYSGTISGSGGLTKQGSGVFTLSGANTYGGATNINAGTLQAGAANTLPGLPPPMSHPARHLTCIISVNPSAHCRAPAPPISARGRSRQAMTIRARFIPASSMVQAA